MQNEPAGQITHRLSSSVNHHQLYNMRLAQRAIVGLSLKTTVWLIRGQRTWLAHIRDEVTATETIKAFMIMLG